MMDLVNLTIDGNYVHINSNSTILEACRSIGIYIPTLCSHPDLSPAELEMPDKEIWQGNKKNT